MVAGTGQCRFGCRAHDVLPTPAVAYLTTSWTRIWGVMLSASHNPMPDNGIKFFSRGGHKLDNAIEDDIEDRLDEPWDRPIGDQGRSGADRLRLGGLPTEGILLDSLPQRLDGLRIVIDCANGAASTLAPEVYASAGAEVIVIHAEPDGLNITRAAAARTSRTSSLPSASTVPTRESRTMATRTDASPWDAHGNVVDGDSHPRDHRDGDAPSPANSPVTLSWPPSWPISAS